MKTMRKLFFSLTTLTAALLILNACQKSDGGGGGTTATPVLTCNVPGTTGCNPGVYQQVSPQLQPYQWSYSGGFCGCSQGLRPVMNAQWGISCAPAGWFPTTSYYGYQYNQVAYQTQNTQWMTIPQVTYSPVISGNTGNCYSTAASVCDIRNANSCATGGVCRPSAGGSYMGFCAYGTGNESYVTQSCNWELDPYQGQVYRCRDNYSGGNASSGAVPR